MVYSLVTAALVLASLAAMPATGPATIPLEVKANVAFTNGQYALALPLLQKVADQYKNQPDKLGPLQEQIKVCKTQLAQANDTGGGALVPTPPQPVGENRKPHPAPKPGETVDLQIKDLGNFDYDADKGGNIPRDVLALSGATIRLHGFMIPIDQTEKITSFALVPSLFACCFGQPPQLQHTIVCKTAGGKSVSYYPDELVVEGKLKVEEKKDDGFIVSIFEVELNSVQPATK